MIVEPTAKARRRVWTEIYQPLVAEGFDDIAHYTAAELTLITDFLRRGRELHERHLARVRDMSPGDPASP